MNTGGKSPVFSPVGGANEAAHILSLMGGPGSGTGAQNHRNEHFSKPKEGGIQYGGIPHLENPRLHGDVKPSPAGQVALVESGGTSLPHALPAGGVGLGKSSVVF